MPGPLADLRVLEIGSIGPGPFAAMLLADLGAGVVRVQRPGAGASRDPLLRGRAAAVGIDLKTKVGVDLVLRLVAGSDVLIEGFRPGVAERLGIGPEACTAVNPRLVYGRVTGWGQTGPRAAAAGHDIDYLAIAGGLHPIGVDGEPPVPPLNLVADFGGGGMLLVVGVLAALQERHASGRGQVVDAAMVDGVTLLMAMQYGLIADGLWSDRRGDNLLDGGAPFYRTYRTADGGYMAVGALEPEFYAHLLDGLGLVGEELPDQYDRSGWGQLHHRFTEAFATRTRTEWTERFAGRDACVVPVLTPAQATQDPHLVDRGTFMEIGGVVQPSPAPRFSRSAAGVRAGAPEEALRHFGLSAEEIAALLDAAS